jgi:hypothetical protein
MLSITHHLRVTTIGPHFINTGTTKMIYCASIVEFNFAVLSSDGTILLQGWQKLYSQFY